MQLKTKWNESTNYERGYDNFLINVQPPTKGILQLFITESTVYRIKSHTIKKKTIYTYYKNIQLLAII